MKIKYQVSKEWDMNISFEELIEYNKDCKIQLNAIHNFETFNGFLLYLSYPNKKEKYTVQLGITDDGFQYEGNYGCCDKYKTIPIEEGLKILEIYRQLIIARDEMECILMKNKTTENISSVNIVMRNNYELENSLISKRGL